MPREQEATMQLQKEEHSSYYTQSNLANDKASTQKSFLSEYLCGGGAIFFCVLLITFVMIIMMIQIVLWRFFDIDIFPVDNTISNNDLSNQTIGSSNRGAMRPKD